MRKREKQAKKKGRGRKLLLALLIALVLAFVFRGEYVHLLGGDRLHVSRQRAITSALSMAGITRRQARGIRTELIWEGSGDYPTYLVDFSYRDASGEEKRVRGFVDGETGEKLGIEPLDN